MIIVMIVMVQTRTEKNPMRENSSAFISGWEVQTSIEIQERWKEKGKYYVILSSKAHMALTRYTPQAKYENPSQILSYRWH